MREYALDLEARLQGIGAHEDSRLLESLAFAEGRLLSIHPFADFNGRVTRVFLAELLRRLDLPAIDPTPEPGAATRRYLAALAASDQRNWEPLKAIWRERCEADRFLAENFTLLTGYAPMRWQARLFSQHFLHGDLPISINVATGLGKTAVMALWLIALAWQKSFNARVNLPRRLVYVVDRRAVVDQATEFAELLRKSLGRAEAAPLREALGLAQSGLPISTLRGQFVDNRRWLEDPSCPAIIVGTVDMVGSRLMFEGYGVSPKMRPYHAGLLGVDAIFMLDEAHLVPPFESLLAGIESSVDMRAPAEADRSLVPSFKLLSLSATGRQRPGEVFALQGSTGKPAGQRDDLDDPVVVTRLSAKKALAWVDAGPTPLAKALVDQAWHLCDEGRLPLRCVVFCNSRDAVTVAMELMRRKPGRDREADTELLVGARRVHEREDAKARLAALGFLAGCQAPAERPVFLFATAAGEVGVDLDADHMVCDLVQWERMVQRLGRVNRRGTGDAQVRVVLDTPKSVQAASERAAKERTDKERQAMEEHLNTRTALKAPFERLPSAAEGGFDVSPGALRQLHADAEFDSELERAILAATTPAPLRPALTRALVDAWAMTSLEEHTGRPEIQPWLRGWVTEEPQTTLVWRTHLPVRPAGGATSEHEVQDFFEAAPPHASEQLETETYRVFDWLVQRCKRLQSGEGNTREGEPMPLGRRDVLGFVLFGANKLRRVLHVHDFVADDAKAKADELKSALAGAVVVLDARIGGLASGLLSDTAEDLPATADAGSTWGMPGPAEPLVKFRVRRVDGEDLQAEEGWSERSRFTTERSDEGVAVQWLVIYKWRGDSSNERDRAIATRPQLLDEHQSWAEAKACELAQRLALPPPWSDMLAMAARLHDEGKRAPLWQRAFRAPLGQGDFAKTRGPINQKLLAHYRHEFGSLPYAQKDEAFAQLPDDLQDLVLHLIAAHHGQARPVIETRGCEDAPPEALIERARGVALRFARVHRRWGPWGLAWWEALLRAADQQASRENEERKAGA